jgi:hypothetical protein
MVRILKFSRLSRAGLAVLPQWSNRRIEWSLEHSRAGEIGCAGARCKMEVAERVPRVPPPLPGWSFIPERE